MSYLYRRRISYAKIFSNLQKEPISAGVVIQDPSCSSHDPSDCGTNLIHCFSRIIHWVAEKRDTKIKHIS